jgi:hypothetical protein
VGIKKGFVVGVKVLVLVFVRYDKYCDVVWVILGYKFCPMEGFLRIDFGVWMGVLVFVPFIWESCLVRTDYNISRERGVELIKKVWECFGIMFSYLWYNHTISVSNVWVGGSKLCGRFSAWWYCFHSQCNLVLGMVMR